MPEQFKYVVRINTVIEKKRVEPNGYSSFSGDRMGFENAFEVNVGTFAQIADILGRLEALSESLREDLNA